MTMPRFADLDKLVSSLRKLLGSVGACTLMQDIYCIDAFTVCISPAGGVEVALPEILLHGAF